MTKEEKKKAYNKAYYAEHREELREKTRARSRKWYTEHKEERAAYRKKKRSEDGEGERARARKYYAEHRDDIRARQKKGRYEQYLSVYYLLAGKKDPPKGPFQIHHKRYDGYLEKGRNGKKLTGHSL